MDKFLLERCTLEFGRDAGSPFIVADRREVGGYREVFFDHIVSFCFQALALACGLEGV